MTDAVEKVVSDPPKRNNRIRTARYLNRNCVRGRDFESMLRIQGRKIVFQQYRPKADIARSGSTFPELMMGSTQVEPSKIHKLCDRIAGLLYAGRTHVCPVNCLHSLIAASRRLSM